jgi:(1->4)-alpha-D-glucan 1-alpha-D-glucosylmutase
MAKLTATYRLQMNAGFTFAQALARVNYFARLGVSHLYLSPIFAARRGSMHGYDVVDPTRINPELGTESDLMALASALREREMGIILDIVPNHMGIGAENSRWEDVLATGERSPYAQWFDIDWTPHKVILPVLGDELEKVLERGELSVQVAEGKNPRLKYFDSSFPLDPATLPPELQLTELDAEETGELADLFSGVEGRDRLKELLELQHYRLVHWRRGPDEINYRRFFDVNDLAAVRIEDASVFSESHATVLDLVKRGVIDGLRIDHIDGLRDPLAYLERLRAALPSGFPVFVEKILSPGEKLRTDWPIDGTTGYEFMNDLEDVFIQPDGAAHIEAAYRRMRRLSPATSFHSIARAGKIATLRGPLHADVVRLARQLVPIAKAAGKKWKAADVEAALIEFMASLPVYRTYIDGRTNITQADRELIEATRADAKTIAPTLAEQIDLIAVLLLGEASSGDEASRIAFATRLQQVSGPATAKGVEDTALYVYVPLVSRNEVGGAPDRPLDQSVARFHAANQSRAQQWPRSLIATNTHDTKRSADVRARLDTLSEVSHEWDRSLHRWRRLNAKHRKPVKGRLSPDTNTEYLLYQTLIALWPPPRPGRRVDDLPDRQWRDSARERLVRYALKAAREAKTSTSWVHPAPDYEKVLDQFIKSILEPTEEAPFLTDVARLVAKLAPIGVANTLSRIVLHLTSPGTPDIYQGDELWNFTLVDPDNRAQVDYDLRQRLLDEIVSQSQAPHEPDHKLKLFVTTRLLHLRRTLPDLFAGGRYVPLAVEGPRANHVVAFARELDGKFVLSVASRLTCDLIGAGSDEFWQGTRIRLPESARTRRWRSVLSGMEIVADETLELANLLPAIPVAVLTE